MRNKKVFCASVSILTAFLFAACGSGAPADELPVDAAGTSGPAVSADQPFDADAGKAIPPEASIVPPEGAAPGEEAAAGEQEEQGQQGQSAAADSQNALAALPADDLYAAYNNTLFIGDSRTESFQLHSGVTNAAYFCAKSLTVDKIVAGKTITVGDQKRTLADMLSAASYDKVIISVGLNELGWNYIEDFIEEYGKLIGLVQESQPQAAVYVQALLPVTAEKSESHPYDNNAQIYWYNTHLVEMAETLGVNYVNAAQAVVDAEGNLAAEATTDGIHLNKEYCIKWAEYLATLL